MERSNPKLRVTKPKSVFTKPLKADFKDLFKALSKGIAHTAIGKWEELGTDAVEALSAIGLSTDPGELAFLLIRRSIAKALFELVGESDGQGFADTKKDADALIEQLDFSISLQEVQIGREFFDHPSELPVIGTLQILLQQWLQGYGLTQQTARAIAQRLPSYFVYALNQEWRRNSKFYRPLVEAIDTPFTKASDQEWAWRAYSALLQRRIDEGIFDEPFSLSQIFVPLNAYYLEDTSLEYSADEMGRNDRRRPRFVISLQHELEQWLEGANRQDSIRVISGGPGSGKSSFARIFAARLAQCGKPKVLFVPLHLIDPSKDIVDEVGRFVRDEGILLRNPLDPEFPESSLLIIFDGLDELASQGKAAAETARAFVREIERTVEKRNLQSAKLRVLISGRELVVQESESEFRRAHQVLTLLPYFVDVPPEHKPNGEEYRDPRGLLKHDLRHQWWKNYGALTSKGYQGLPPELRRHDLDEITAQPLLNYLVAHSFTRDKLDFTKDVNLNSIYGDLVGAVYERGYEKHRPYGPIRHMNYSDFSRVLEEIGLAAWHGDGRTTTVREIEEHCRASGVGILLDVFQEGAKSGVTRLLAAFFFRQYGQRPSGDSTFVFTHKSFGEYLTARRVVRAVERVIRELDRRAKNPDEGWDERDALKHWSQICGPSSMSQYLHVFLLNEIGLRPASELAHWQGRFAKLFDYMLRHGMPMEQLQLGSFREALFQSRNAEEGLLVALNACANITGHLSVIGSPDHTVFGAWFKRIQGQRTGPESGLAARCLSFLDISYAFLDIGDFYRSNFRSAKLQQVQAHFCCFTSADLRNADLSSGVFWRADLEDARLEEANLDGADLREANLRGADLRRATLQLANLEEADLQGADLTGANLTGAKLKGAKLRGAKLERPRLERPKLERPKLERPKLAGKTLPASKHQRAKMPASLSARIPKS